MDTWGKYRNGGLSFTQGVFTGLGTQRTSYLQSVALSESGGATPAVTNAGRSAAQFVGNATNKLTSDTNIVLAATGNSWFVICRFVWNGFYLSNNTCRIVGIGSSKFEIVAGTIQASFVPDTGDAINRQGGTVITGENIVIAYGSRLTGNMETFLNGSSLGTNPITGEFANARQIVFGDTATNHRGSFDVLELAWGDGSPSLDILTSTMRTTVTGASEFLDVAPLAHATGGTADSNLSFVSAILGGRSAASYNIGLEKAAPKPGSGYSTVGTGATRTGPGTFTLVDPNAGDLAYYRGVVTSTSPAAETFRTSNYSSKQQVHEVGNPYPGAAPTPQNVPAVGAFPLTSGMPRAIHGLGDSRFPVTDFKTVVSGLTGRNTSEIYAVSRPGSNWRHWQDGDTSYAGTDIYGAFKTGMAAVGAQAGDWVVVMLDVNSLEPVDNIGDDGYTDAVRTVCAQIVADGWVPKVVLDPLSAAFVSSTFDNYQGHQAVIAAAVTAAGGGAAYMTAGNVRRYFNSRMPEVSTDRTHWDVAGAATILARMIGADLLSLVALDGGTVSLPADQTGVSSLYVQSVTPATGGGSLAYQWQDYTSSWGDLTGETTVGNTVVSGIRSGATKLRRKVSNGSEIAYSNELTISLSTGGSGSGEPSVTTTETKTLTTTPQAIATSDCKLQMRLGRNCRIATTTETLTVAPGDDGDYMELDSYATLQLPVPFNVGDGATLYAWKTPAQASEVVKLTVMK